MISNNECSNIVVDGKHYDSYTEPPVLMSLERKRTSFPVREMTHYLDGGADQTAKQEAVMRELEFSPKFENWSRYDIEGDHEKLREQTFKRVAAVNELLSDGRDETEIRRLLSFVQVIDPAATTRCGVHYGLFLDGLRAGGTPEQLNYWIERGAGNLTNFFGCFAMTELGHGSNVAGLETTATYDRETEEFVINTPTVAATKWWIGGLAHSASHTLCYARLLIDGKDYGVKQFVVPLRNRSNWELLPGISVGDIGRKLGRDGIDNGWGQFSNVRIPRLFMLQRFSQVHADGTYVERAPAQLSYGALVGGRVSMIEDSYKYASRFVTIAIRYAAVRRQFAQDKDVETILLDYKLHQRRLLPILAHTYAMKAGSRRVDAVYRAAMGQLASTNPKDKARMGKAVNDVKELFALSAGLKAACTWSTLAIIDECRQSCGGHGYSAYNGFVDWNSFAVQVTWEGDNNVLSQSCGRALIGGAAAAGAKAVAAKTLGGRSLSDPKVLVEAWTYIKDKALEQGVQQFTASKAAGTPVDTIWEELSYLKLKVARLSSRAFLVSSFFEDVSNANAELKPVLTQLATLFALSSIEQESASFLEYKFLVPDALVGVSQLVTKYCALVRDQAIGLTDSFNWSDYFINSPIGNYDGNVYKNYFSKVLRQNPKDFSSKPRYFDSVIQPFFKRQAPEEYDLTPLEAEEKENL